jgi:hypothetical protein
MKKVLFIASFLFCAGLAHGQYLKSDGSFINSTGTLGYCMPGGIVQNPSHTVIGYIVGDSVIQDSHHAVIGYVRTGGIMEDSHSVVLGYFLHNVLQDSHHTMIGQFGKQTEASLKLYFFP